MTLRTEPKVIAAWLNLRLLSLPRHRHESLLSRFNYTPPPLTACLFGVQNLPLFQPNCISMSVDAVVPLFKEGGSASCCWNSQPALPL